MPTFEELHAADNAHSKANLNTLLLEFSATLARLPSLQRELQGWLAQDAQAVDFAVLQARAESVLVLAANWLLDYDHLPVEIRQAKAMQDFIQTAGDTVTCRTVTGLVQKFQALLKEETQYATEQKTREATRVYGWQKHGLGGESLDVTAKQWAALTDCKTGLMWAVNCGRLDFPNRGDLTWKGAHEWVRMVNQYGWCGYHDWRLPSIEELKTLLLQRNGVYDRAFHHQFFTESFATDWFWSSSPVAGYSARAWGVHFGNGSHSYGLKGSNFNVRLLRYGQIVDNLAM